MSYSNKAIICPLSCFKKYWMNFQCFSDFFCLVLRCHLSFMTHCVCQCADIVAYRNVWLTWSGFIKKCMKNASFISSGKPCVSGTNVSYFLTYENNHASLVRFVPDFMQLPSHGAGRFFGTCFTINCDSGILAITSWF